MWAGATAAAAATSGKSPTTMASNRKTIDGTSGVNLHAATAGDEQPHLFTLAFL